MTANNVATKFVHVRHVDVALISDSSELLSITYILDSMNIGYDIYNDNKRHLYTENLDLLLRYSTIIFYTDYRTLTLEEHSTLQSYLSLGGNLIITGFDCLIGDNLLADVVRSSTVGDNVGEPDLYVVNETHPIIDGPYGSFPAGYYISGLYSDCDAAEADLARGAVTVAELEDRYDKIIATEGLPGKVVFWNGRGDRDWAGNADCEVMLKNTVDWMQAEYEHELSVSLEAPSFLRLSDSSLLNATVQNRGLNNETDVELYLIVNGVVVSNVTIPKLPNGTFYTLNYSWTPTVEGVYNVTVYAPPVREEIITRNNIVSTHVVVAETFVSVNPTPVKVDPSESFNVTLEITNVTGLFGYDLKLYYDTNILDGLNVTLPPNHFLTPKDPSKLCILKQEIVDDYNATYGLVRVVATLLAPESPKNGSGTLVEIKFKATSRGSSILHLGETQLSAEWGVPILHGASNGLVLVGIVCRDVAVISVEPFTSELYIGWTVNITVVVENQGDFTETFNVTLYYNSNIVGTETLVDLVAGAGVNLTFTWNTTGLDPGNYTIKAVASTVPEEIDISDNTYVDGVMKIKIDGDVNGDGIVNLFDLTIMADAFGCHPGDLCWNLQADLKRDNIINLFDLVIAGVNFGNHI
ncbi:MAG: CARDB domain-containing protein [Thermoproteota archaeon]|nr:CARDB domain-containing protein [Thermoproteota archaeon]